MLILMPLAFLFFAVVVAFRRLFYGRKRPTWPFLLEITVLLLRWVIGRTVHQDLEHLRARIGKGKLPSSPILFRVEVRPVDVGGLEGEWILPRQGESEGVILYLHGGGYAFCSLDTHRDLMARLALASKGRLLGINYRLAPEHPFPAPIEDAMAAYCWLLDQGREAQEIVLVGDSAGGGLALATLMALRDAGKPLPAGAALLSPWVDLGAEGGSMVSNAPYDYIGGHPDAQRQLASLYLGQESPRHPLASPVYGDFTGLPPLLIHAGGAEILHDQILLLAQRAQEAGVETQLTVGQDMVHVWHAFAMILPQSREAIAQVGRFVRERTGARRLGARAQG